MSQGASNIPRLVLGGVSSGVGKTTVTVALARALRARGLRVAMFKCGPDYLDPTYHARAIDGVSHNLDGWMMGPSAVHSTFLDGTRDADVALIEGVMGLFDGASARSEEGSTAEIAKWLRAPVILVVDAGGMARSFSALVHGFASFDPALQIAGVIANRVGSRGHLDLLHEAHVTPPLLGGLPRDEQHAFAERHLGLRTADEHALPAATLDRWASLAESWLDLDTILTIAGDAPALEANRSLEGPATATCCRIGIAYDEAFHFYYSDNLRRLEQRGAELVRFSPMHEACLPDVDGLYIGGGYPEVHARELSTNIAMREAMLAFARRGGPIYAECGGLMYLTQGIRCLGGEHYCMVGLLPGEARMCERLQALGYVEVETGAATILGPAGTRFRGHQFRYSELVPAPSPGSVEHTYDVRRRRNGESLTEGYKIGNTLASYVHAHWSSNPQIPTAFVDSCTRFRSEKSTRAST